MAESALDWADHTHLPELVGQRRELEKRVRSLCRELEITIQGEVRFDSASRALYAQDSGNFHAIPVGVVIPRSTADVIEAVKVANRYGIPILNRGAGTSLGGQTTNTALVIDSSKYWHEILELDVPNKWVRVQPGAILDDVRKRVHEAGLELLPDPSTHEYCTLGGMIANNAGGVHTQRSGVVMHQVEELEILTYDGVRMTVGPTTDEELSRIIAAGGRQGEIYRRLYRLRERYADLIRERYPQIPRRVSGYNLDQLLPESGFNVARAIVGTEGTIATILSAKLRLFEFLPEVVTVLLGYDDVFKAADDIPRIGSFNPDALEGMDHQLIKQMREAGIHVDDLNLLPEGKGYLLVEFGGKTKEEAVSRRKKMMDALKASGNCPPHTLYDDKEIEMRVWEVRESGLGATAFVPGEPDTWPGWEDSAVHPSDLGKYLRDLQDLYDKYGYQGAMYGHFGTGLVHSRISFDLQTREGVDNYRAFLYEAAELCASYNGSFSGEHGDGQQRAELLYIMYGRELMEAFREFKRIWDPDNKMNPGKIPFPRRLDQDLRLGPDYQPWEPKTYFKYPSDEGKFSRAALRCVGVGKCRNVDSGTMCPSYQVTREEMHTTRGRARLLFEMLNNVETPTSWDNEDVKESLDLCLSCKGCKGDCPVDVDMATYKAEFLAHYYEGKVRPRAAYSMGLIQDWALAAARAPRLANFFTQTPGLSALAKKAGGIAQERDIPKFATQTFRQWLSRRRAPVGNGPEVVLFADTFNNYLHPQHLIDAVHVFERLGFRVIVPKEALCCGRPLYDFGFLDRAQARLRQLMRYLAPLVGEDRPLVGLEPSCVATFRDELHEMFPDDKQARRLTNHTLTFAEFMQNYVDEPLPPVPQHAIVHGHCHHKAIMKFEADEELLKRLRLDYEILDSGCCGMAGAFGFEHDKYDISVAIGERVLLPRVRKADQRSLILADGFSCQTQIKQLTRRTATHVVSVVRRALEGPGNVTNA